MAMLANLANVDSTQAVQRLQKSIDEHLQQLGGLRSLWANPNHVYGVCIDMAESIRKQHPAFASLVGVGPDARVVWQVPASQTAKAALTEGPSAIVIDGARATSRPAVIDGSSGAGQSLDVVFSPLGPRQRSILARIDLPLLIETALDDSDRRDLNIEVRDGDRVVTVSSHGALLQPIMHRVVRIGDRVLQLRLWPTSEAIELRTSRIAIWVLWGGLAVSLLLGIILGQFLLPAVARRLTCRRSNRSTKSPRPSARR